MEPDDLARRLLAGAATDDEREIIRRLLDHQQRYAHARSLELFVTGMNQLHAAFAEERERLRKYVHQLAVLTMLKVLALCVLIFAAYLLLRQVMP